MLWLAKHPLFALALLIAALLPAPLTAQEVTFDLEVFFMSYAPSAALGAEKRACPSVEEQVAAWQGSRCSRLTSDAQPSQCVTIPLTDRDGLAISFSGIEVVRLPGNFSHDAAPYPPPSQGDFPDDDPDLCANASGRVTTTRSTRGRSGGPAKSQLQAAPGSIAQTTPRPGRIYVATTGNSFGAGEIRVLDPAARAHLPAIDVAPAAGAEIKALAVNDEETLLVAATNRNHDGTLPIPLDNGSVFFIDLPSGSVKGQLKFPQRAFPPAMRFTSGGETLYVLDRANFTTQPEPARLYVVDVASRSITKTIPLPAAGAAVDMALTPDDAVLFISVQRTDERGARYTELHPLDTRTGTFNGVIRLPGFTSGPIAMNPAGTRIYAPHRGPIMVIDTATYGISEMSGVTVPISDVYGASVSSSGRYLVLSVTNEFKITVVDVISGAIVSVLEADGRLTAPALVLR